MSCQKRIPEQTGISAYLPEYYPHFRIVDRGNGKFVAGGLRFHRVGSFLLTSKEELAVAAPEEESTWRLPGLEAECQPAFAGGETGGRGAVIRLNPCLEAAKLYLHADRLCSVRKTEPWAGSKGGAIR